MSETVMSLDAVVANVIAERWQIESAVVARALELIRADHPIPYLARYRRDDVGGLDEGALRDLRDEADAVRELEQRREFILRGLRGRGDVPEKAIKRIEKARSRVELEYLYAAHEGIQNDIACKRVKLNQAIRKLNRERLRVTYLSGRFRIHPPDRLSPLHKLLSLDGVLLVSRFFA